MALQKQPVNIPFAAGVDTKSDPKQIPPGKFAVLNNTVFNKGNLLQKRPGYGKLATLTDATTITTYNDGLVAIGNSVQSYSAAGATLVNSGMIAPIDLVTTPLVRRATSQTTVDVALAENGITCSVWIDGDISSYYQISDSTTSQTIIPATSLPSTAFMPRVFVVGRNFVITFLATVAGSPHLRYITIPISNPSSPGSAVDIATTVASISVAYDGIVANDTLYITWNASDGGGALRTVLISSTLAMSSPVIIASQAADFISLTADTTGSTAVIWLSFYRVSTNTIKVYAYSATLSVILTTTTAVSSITINELASSASNNVVSIFYEVANTYSYSPNAKSDYIAKNTVTIAGVVGTPSVILRGVGLNSKAIYDSINSKTYMLATYGQTYQPTNFLIDQSGNVLLKIAYENGVGYARNQILPSINLINGAFSVGYLFKDLLAAVNKTQGVANTAGVYSQTGINLASFTFGAKTSSVDIGRNLHMSGGFLWMYDGVKPVEHGFFIYPEDIVSTPASSGGSMADQQYYYKVCYEWTDNQGNIHRSAPSVPASAMVSGGSGSGSVTVNIPYLRLTYKTANKVRLVIYRWSTGQQNYYRITSITSPTLNNPAADSVAYVDTLSDSSILGNDLIYTTGGVVENISPSAVAGSLALIKQRVFYISAEDPNILGYSKQVLASTPAEFSDLFTIYVAPTTGAQGSTGPTTAISAMDDKIIIFKRDAIYYATGNGPDNTGANNDFSEPTFITSTVGCSNPSSIILTPEGLMFQSDKGIWLLGRGLQTRYIGAPVDDFNDRVVTSAVSVPGTNQIRFTLDDRATLMYDYYYDQWGTFYNLPAVSSTIYEGLHTYLNSYGQIMQETPEIYVDGSSPVLINFETGWFNLAGLQGFERAYFFYLLAQYISPHKLIVQIAYDYNPSPTQLVVISPDNYSGPYGSETLYGGGIYGGQINKEQWRVFFEQQKCQAFKLFIREIFDPSLGTTPGAGFTMSGLNLIVGIKDGKPRLSTDQSVG